MQDKRLNNSDNLKEEIYKLSWAGKYWGKAGALAYAKQLYQIDKNKKVEHALSARSSTYYSASGNAFSLSKRATGLKKLGWVAMAIWCLLKAFKFSNQLEDEVGLENLSADELDIRATILRRCGRKDMALRRLEIASKRPGLTIDTQILLLVGLAEVTTSLGIASEALWHYKRAQPFLENAKPTTTVRYHKSLGEHHLKKDRDRALIHLKKAREIAVTNNLGDQVEKIEALMR